MDNNRIAVAVIAALSALVGLVTAIWLFPGFRLIVEYFHPELPLVITAIAFGTAYCLTPKK